MIDSPCVYFLTPTAKGILGSLEGSFSFSIPVADGPTPTLQRVQVAEPSAPAVQAWLDTVGSTIFQPVLIRALGEALPEPRKDSHGEAIDDYGVFTVHASDEDGVADARQALLWPDIQLLIEPFDRFACGGRHRLVDHLFLADRLALDNWAAMRRGFLAWIVDSALGSEWWTETVECWSQSDMPATDFVELPDREAPGQVLFALRSMPVVGLRLNPERGEWTSLGLPAIDRLGGQRLAERLKARHAAGLERERRFYGVQQAIVSVPGRALESTFSTQVAADLTLEFKSADERYRLRLEVKGADRESAIFTLIDFRPRGGDAGRRFVIELSHGREVGLRTADMREIVCDLEVIVDRGVQDVTGAVYWRGRTTTAKVVTLIDGAAGPDIVVTRME